LVSDADEKASFADEAAVVGARRRTAPDYSIPFDRVESPIAVIEDSATTFHAPSAFPMRRRRIQTSQAANASLISE
jgi:hypothetical protein